MLYGPKNCGKSALVAVLARSWLGEEGPEGDRARQAFDRGANPDYFPIAPRGTGNQIQVRQISPPRISQKDDPIPLSEFMRVPPLYSKHKVIWIDQVDRLNKDSANSLLKPLEEPPSYARIILTTSEVSQIPQTILSRCLVINCELPTGEEFEALIGQQHRELFIFAENAPGAAKEILEHPGLYSQLLQLVHKLANGSPYQALVLSEEVKATAEQWEKALPKGQRTTNARVVELLALGMSRLYPQRPGAVALLIDAHRKILGNVQSGLVLDAIIARLLLEQS